MFNGIIHDQIEDFTMDDERYIEGETQEEYLERMEIEQHDEEEDYPHDCDDGQPDLAQEYGDLYGGEDDRDHYDEF